MFLPPFFYLSMLQCSLFFIVFFLCVCCYLWITFSFSISGTRMDSVPLFIYIFCRVWLVVLYCRCDCATDFFLFCYLSHIGSRKEDRKEKWKSKNKKKDMISFVMRRDGLDLVLFPNLYTGANPLCSLMRHRNISV